MVRFGAFAIDTRTWTLSHDGVVVDLSPRLVEILAYLVDMNGDIVTRDELLDRFWSEVHVTENTLTRAIADIRKALGDPAEHPTVIQTLARRGYRFVGTRHQDGSPLSVATHAPVNQRSDPFRLWVSGRLALESLDPARLDEARRAMESTAIAMPDYAPAHAGAANARVVAFERSRIANRPDVALLRGAVASAEQAVALDPRLGEGWAVLGHALALAGSLDDAQASLRRAIALDPDSWRHQVRLALATWGEARLRAADRALDLWPSCAAAHLLSGMVFIARGAWTRAEDAAAAGAQL
jgi:DNA-binding winged helix-turn-helix (wHTH) protein